MFRGHKSVSFDPARDIPSLEDKVILVTGGNIGLGKQCILEYARHNPATIWLAARNLDKAKAAVDEIQGQLTRPADIKLLELDLSSLESVKKAAARLLGESVRLDILMLNAGIMATPPGLTTDGYEVQFGTNYLSHALLTRLLMPLLKRTSLMPDADVRVVAVSSHGHVFVPKEGIHFDTLRTDAEDIGPYGRYSQSKLAMILWTRQMAKLNRQITFAAIHPGIVKTNLANGATGSNILVRGFLKVANMVVTSVEEGAKNQLWASVAEGVKSGEYYEPIGVTGQGSALCTRDEFVESLWEWTEQELDKISDV
ncbi:hypothetical protein BDV96DRAFT_507613 [Lophiotrema nucula]|uniref:Short-chain dehydrogenase/reductase n=1 Tax=Lophiotrema nucula TaxID=690887 RepID=A0A6A5YJM5_9PLEO|nr:hypothetical protein BDV96DRAFT_507613 [Lophiotrema nucula]